MDAILRLFTSIFICWFIGALVNSVVHYIGGPHSGTAIAFAAPATAAFLCFVGALWLLRLPWEFENLPRRFGGMVVLAYAGFFLTWWAMRSAGKVSEEPTVWNTVVAVLSFQGAALLLIGRFLREHDTRWLDSFGLKLEWKCAVAYGALAVLPFLPVGIELQTGSVFTMQHLHLSPHEQEAVQVLRVSKGWGNQFVLGVAAILVAPVAEETLFRGILYSAIKYRGFPRAAVWITALGFGAIHANLATFLPLTVLALVLVWLYERTGKLARLDNGAQYVQRTEFCPALRYPLVGALDRIFMNEFELIAKLTRSLPTNKSVVVGSGDDCAVLDTGLPDRFALFKADAVVEGIDFAQDSPPESIGHKALGRCLSDIAAMAGTPTAALVTLGLPRDFDPNRIAEVYSGMNALARRHELAIVGGETTTNPGGLLISVALIGSVPRGKAALRSGAEVGDALFVTGSLAVPYPGST